MSRVESFSDEHPDSRQNISAFLSKQEEENKYEMVTDSRGLDMGGEKS